MASASNINVSFLEVKKKGAVLEKDFQEVQDVLEAWAKKKSYKTRFGALTDHDSTTLTYVVKDHDHFRVYWSPIAKGEVRFAFAFYTWLALKAKGMNDQGLLGQAKMKPSVVQFQRLDWWKQERDNTITAKQGGQRNVGVKRAVEAKKASGENKAILEQEANQKHEASVKRAVKQPCKRALKDLLVPIPNAKPTYGYPRNEEDVSRDVFAPVCQALGKMIYALQPVQTRQQVNITTGMLECLSEVHRSVHDNDRSRAPRGHDWNSNQAGWNRAQSGGVQDMASASSINLSLLEVKGAVLEKDFQEVQDVLEAWAKKSVRDRKLTDTWQDVISRENALHYVYPQIIN
ncbi:hypothetical protein BT69DRAFT_1293245 [Atractiella rhizophila]|nr:hypothetical protein BT69DRAFT_1293245 [Atractiella rhizophila]